MRQIRDYVCLTLLCLALYLPGLASLPLFDRDEPHFAQASRQMLEAKDYSRINFQYEARHLKPPGIYWLQATAVRLFSSAESIQPWPYRLPSVLGGLLAVWLTFGLGCRLVDRKTAGLAAVLLACSLLLIVEAHLAVTDAVLLAAMTAMQFALMQIYTTYPRPQRCEGPWSLIFWIAMAVGVFIKGITPLVGGLTIIGLLIMDRQRGWLKGLHYRWGIPLLLLLTAAWVVPFSLASGHNFLWDIIRNDALPKLASNQQSHGMPPGYFSLIFTGIFWPASLFIVPTGIWAWRHRQALIVRFLGAWILPTWIFFEIVYTKLPEYVLPVFPAIALLMALSIRDGESTKKIRHKGLFLLRVLQQGLWIVGTLGLIGTLIYIGGWAAWWAALLILGAAGYLLIIFYSASVSYRQVMVGVIMASSAFIPIWQWVLPNLQTIWISPRLVALMAQTAPDVSNDLNPILAVDYQEPSLIFLLGTHRVIRARMADAIVRTQRQRQSIVLVSQPDFPCFMVLMQKGNLIWRSLGTVDGFEYNHNHSITVYVILISGVISDFTNAYQTNFLGSLARSSDYQLLFCGSTLNNFRSSDRLTLSLVNDYFFLDHKTGQ